MLLVEELTLNPNPSLSQNKIQIENPLKSLYIASSSSLSLPQSANSIDPSDSSTSLSDRIEPVLNLLPSNMPPRKPRKTAGSGNCPPPVVSDPQPTKAATKRKEKMSRLFDSYANTLMNMIDPEGIERLCSDMEVDYTDVRILMLAWKMGAEKQGYFTEEEWKRGLKALKSETLDKLKKALPELEKEANSPTNFEDFYSYAFKYCLTEERQKVVDVDTVCQLLDIVLGPKFPNQTKLLREYLSEQKDYRAINMDQWMGFLRFFNEINFPSLENYDPSVAWPVILDEFADWVKEKQS